MVDRVVLRAGAAGNLLLVLAVMCAAQTVTEIPLTCGLGFGVAGSHESVSVADGGALAVISDGCDILSGGLDDQIVVLSDAGGSATVTMIGLWAITESAAQSHRLVGLGGGAAVYPTPGGDLRFGTPDDQVIWLSMLGGAPAAVLRPLGGAGPIPGSVLLGMSDGRLLFGHETVDLNGNVSSHTDFRIGLTTGLPDAPATSHLALPLTGQGGGVRVSGTHAVFVATGPDLAPGTADDALVIVDLSGTAPAFTVVPAPRGIQSFIEKSGPALLGDDAVLFATWGADGQPATCDDTIDVLTGVASAPVLVSLAVGDSLIDPWFGLRAPGVARDTAVFPALGPDRVPGTADDTLVLVSAKSGGPVLTVMPSPVPLGHAFVRPRATGVSDDVVLIPTFGIDGHPGTPEDDGVVVVSGLAAGSPLVRHMPTEGPVVFVAGASWNSAVATLVDGRIVFLFDLDRAVPNRQTFWQDAAPGPIRTGQPILVGPGVVVTNRRGDAQLPLLADNLLVFRLPAYRSFGRGSAGAFDMRPVMGTLGGTPYTGNTEFGLRVSGAAPVSVAGLFIAAAGGSWRIDPETEILIDVSSIFRRYILWTSAAGDAALPIGIPGDPLLRGSSVFAQWAVLDATADAGFTVSDGIEVRF